jgi:dienelactone hydrolase
MSDPKPDLGTFYEALESVSKSFEPSFSFLSKEREDADEWRVESRKKIDQLLGFYPKAVSMNATVDSKSENNGIITEEISYDLPYGPRTRGFFLYPKNRGQKRLPGFLALHDHGGYYYFGKEKVVNSLVHSESLTEFKKAHYGGKSWANELAGRGFAVLSIDVSLWGSRKIPLETVNSELVGHFDGLKLGSEDYIQQFNQYWDSTEASITIATMLNSGTCWPAIHLYEDKRSIDYLAGRPEVDPQQIGCGGLSMGGQRTIYLAGMDSRIKFAVCVGFMSTVREMLRNHIHGHGVGFYVPGLIRLMDLPDVISLHAPAPLMVQYNNQDGLFTLESQHAADTKISKIYSKMGRGQNYVGRFYDGRHKFDLEMQEDAFEWLDRQTAY